MVPHIVIKFLRWETMREECSWVNLIIVRRALRKYRSRFGRIECCQQGGNLEKVPTEMPIKICEPQKSLECRVKLRDGPFYDSMYLVGVHADPLRRQNRTEKCNRLGMKHAFLGLDEETVLKEALNYMAHVLYMHLGRGRKNKNIVQVSENKHIEHVP